MCQQGGSRLPFSAMEIDRSSLHDKAPNSIHLPIKYTVWYQVEQALSLRALPVQATTRTVSAEANNTLHTNANESISPLTAQNLAPREF
jgi:hypothetical protein